MILLLYSADDDDDEQVGGVFYLFTKALVIHSRAFKS